MKIKVKNNSVSPQKLFAVGRGSYGFDTVEFEFSRDWKSLEKTVVFVAPDGAQTNVDYNGEVRIPKEILAARGSCRIFVIGKDGDLTKTSVPIELWVAGNLPSDKQEEV